MSTPRVRTWPLLRIAVIGAGVAGTLFCIAAVVEWWLIADTHRDGLELMGLALAGGFFVMLVLPTLMLGILGRGLIAGAALGLGVIALVTDTLWHWLPW